MTLNDANIRLAINEYVCAQTLNRCIQLLLKNDDACMDMYEKVFGGLSITAYGASREYMYGDIVWRYDDQYDKRQPGTGVFRRLWLLKSIEDHNRKDPLSACVDLNAYGYPDFEKYGWTDLNYHIDIFDEKLGLTVLLLRRIDKWIRQHESNRDSHPFGKLDSSGLSPDGLQRKLLNRTMSNIAQGRRRVFFPYESGHFSDGTILNGTYRIWDCGLVEFDVVFRFGFAGVDSQGYDLISCNNVRIQQSPTRQASASDYQENMKYFYSLDDTSIFQNLATDATFESTVGNMRQGNRNDYVNAYFADLNLFGRDDQIRFKGMPIEFDSLDYMVFASSCLSQDKSAAGRTMSRSANDLVWCNKTKRGLTAVLITYSGEDQIGFGAEGGIAANSCSCHIVGKWKNK